MLKIPCLAVVFLLSVSAQSMAAGLADFEKQISHGAKSVDSSSSSSTSSSDSDTLVGDCDSFASCFFGALAQAMLRGLADWLVLGMVDMYASEGSGDDVDETDTQQALDALNGEQNQPLVVNEPDWQGQLEWSNGLVADSVVHSALAVSASKARLQLHAQGDYFRDSGSADQMGLSRFYAQYWSRQDRALRIAFGLGSTQLSSNARLRSTVSLHSALRYHVDAQWQLDLQAHYFSFGGMAVEDYRSALSWHSEELPALQTGLAYRSLQVGEVVLAGPQLLLQYRF